MRPHIARLMSSKVFHILCSSGYAELFFVSAISYTAIDHLKRPFLIRVLLNVKSNLLNEAVAYSLRRPVNQNTIPNLHTALTAPFFSTVYLIVAVYLSHFLSSKTAIGIVYFYIISPLLLPAPTRQKTVQNLQFVRILLVMISNLICKNYFRRYVVSATVTRNSFIIIIIIIIIIMRLYLREFLHIDISVHTVWSNRFLYSQKQDLSL